MTWEQFTGILSQYTSLPIDRSSALFIDLGLDSFTMMQIICDFEEQNADFDFSALCNIVTVEDLFHVIQGENIHEN